MWPNSTNSWGSWIPQNKGNFNASDQVDWASLAKQWMQHRDVVGSSDILSDSVESCNSQVWFAPPINIKESTTLPDVEKFMDRRNETESISSNDVHKSMPAWAVPPPPPPLPPHNTIPLESRAQINQIKNQTQTFPLMWNHPGVSIYSNKTTHSRSDFDISSSWMSSSNDNALLDATKRKQLPAWIREGLEKIEKDKFKRLEKDQEVNIEEKEISQYSLQGDQHESSDRESIIIDNEEIATKIRDNSKNEISLTDEERLADLMQKVRRMLTEILLEVTNEEISLIANSVYYKAKSRQNRGEEGESEYEDKSDELSSSDESEMRLKTKKKMSIFETKMAILDDDRGELKGNIKTLTDFQVRDSHEVAKPNITDMKSERNILIDYSKPIINKELESVGVNKGGLSLHPFCGFDVSSCKSLKASVCEKLKNDNVETVKDEKLIRKKSQDLKNREHEEVRSRRNSHIFSNDPKNILDKTSFINDYVLSKSKRNCHKDERVDKEERQYKAGNKKKRSRSRSSSLERSSKKRRYRRDRRRESKSRSR